MAYWIEDNKRPASTLFKCSKCDSTAYYYTGVNSKTKATKICRYKFCPNCGADMTEDKEDEDTVKELAYKIQFAICRTILSDAMHTKIIEYIEKEIKSNGQDNIGKGN